VWFPLSSTPHRRNSLIEVLGRLQPGFSRQTAAQEIEAIVDRELAEAPRQMFGGDDVGTRLDRPADRFGGGTREALLVLLAAVGLVLLVACSNVANLLLARGVSRARELALRSALGASTWRLVRALLAECLVLALAAGAVGIALGWATLRILVRLRPDSLGAPLGEVRLDATVLAFTFGVCVATALVFGLAPAAQLVAQARRCATAWRVGSRAGGSGARLPALVAAQMTRCRLLVSAGPLSCASSTFRTSCRLRRQNCLRRDAAGRMSRRRAATCLPSSCSITCASPGIAAATQRTSRRRCTRSRATEIAESRSAKPTRMRARVQLRQADFRHARHPHARGAVTAERPPVMSFVVSQAAQHLARGGAVRRNQVGTQLGNGSRHRRRRGFRRHDTREGRSAVLHAVSSRAGADELRLAAVDRC
jgi:hypothetical protein